MAPSIIHLPEMALTLVRRASAKLPYNHFLFRTDTQWTKAEIREYLEKVYGVSVARIATAVSLGKVRRVTGRRALYKLKDYKKVYVRLHDDKTAVSPPPPELGEVNQAKAAELR